MCAFSPEFTHDLSIRISEEIYALLNDAMGIQADISANRVTRRQIADRYANMARSLRNTLEGVANVASVYMSDAARNQSQD